MWRIMFVSLTTSDDDIGLALDLANELSHWRRGALAPEPRLEPRGDRRLPPDSVRLRRARRELRSVLASPTLEDACAAINDLLRHIGATPLLAPSQDGRWRMRLRSGRTDGVSRTVVRAATALASLVDTNRWNSLRRCAADRCDDYFVDRSRNGSRRFCSRTCANRVNARTFRSRRGAGR